jgi:23S rRNA (cytosine1962-C5)-methyltransferase
VATIPHLSFEQIKRVPLHQLSLRELKKGHPWITKDQYTKRFPPKQFFLFGCDQSRREICLFIHDPQHRKIKGRVWQKYPFSKAGTIDFASEFGQRVQKALEKRVRIDLRRERENLYLIFGEADYLPGLFVQMVGEQILIQTYACFWQNLQPLIKDELQKNLKNYYGHLPFNIWIEDLSNPADRKLELLSGNLKRGGVKSHKFIVQEFGVQYLVQIQKDRDLGIYSDISSIRKKLTPYFKKTNSLLNLFSYTGAFSIFALKSGAKEVTSVDQSAKHMEWLEQNLSLNPEIRSNRHTSLCRPVDKVLMELQRKGKSFNFIICDPPSTYTSGKKMDSAYRSYSKLLPQLCQLVRPGGYLLLFLNTHQVSLQRFRTQIDKILATANLDQQIRERKWFGLAEDCPTLHGFKEGSYLKGVLLQQKG